MAGAAPQRGNAQQRARHQAAAHVLPGVSVRARAADGPQHEVVEAYGYDAVTSKAICVSGAVLRARFHIEGVLAVNTEVVAEVVAET
jgi:hypothetical protein